LGHASFLHALPGKQERSAMLLKYVQAEQSLDNANKLKSQHSLASWQTLWQDFLQ